MTDKAFYTFYKWLFFTSSLPFIAYALPFMPGTILGFNITGWAWIIMLGIGLLYMPKVKSFHFPLQFWMPWAFYISAYLAVQFSFPGLQLILQYLLPLLVGAVASGFTYDDHKYRWLFRMLCRLCGFVVLLFAAGYLFRGGYTPAAAATPMLLSILAALLIGLFYLTGKQKYALVFGILFLVPFIDMTRMGVAVFIVILLVHFANRNVASKIVMAGVGLLLVTLVLNSDKFREKTLRDSGGTVTLSDISGNLNYYENENIRNSGRTAFYAMLKPGIDLNPVFGNGPRADGQVLSSVYYGEKQGEAHNDYLSVTYNYGYTGLALLLFGFGSTFLALLSTMRKTECLYRRLIVTSTMTLMVGFLMFMYSDNILKYTIFFPNLFFALAGIVFAPYRSKS
jgi:hypothetical protein